MKNRPSILTIAGHDPTGGAGIQADIETINALGGHACSIVTALTVQNSTNLISFEPVSPELIHRQFLSLQQDFTFRAIKIGLIGSPALVDILAEMLALVPDIPVILDPVLAAGGGASVANNSLIGLIKSKLLAKITLITPNTLEARLLSGQTTADDCANSLMQSGCKHILITGTHETSDNVVNRLYSEAGKISLEAPRLPLEYHGSGCTLSSSIAFYLASGHSLTNSVKLAQEFTFASLENADHPGHGQAFPVRNQNLWL